MLAATQSDSQALLPCFSLKCEFRTSCRCSWNEPNQPGSWDPQGPGDPYPPTKNMSAQWPLFEDLFIRAVRGLKAADLPDVKIGGPAFAIPESVISEPQNGVDLVEFVHRLVNEQVPVDFFSWHRCVLLRLTCSRL